jgi:hypothetical protein
MQAAVPSIVFYLRDKDATNSHVYDGPLVETEGMSGIFFSLPLQTVCFMSFFFKYSSVFHMSLVETEGMRILYFYSFFIFIPLSEEVSLSYGLPLSEHGFHMSLNRH